MLVTSLINSSGLSRSWAWQQNKPTQKSTNWAFVSVICSAKREKQSSRTIHEKTHNCYHNTSPRRWLTLKWCNLRSQSNKSKRFATPAIRQIFLFTFRRLKPGTRTVKFTTKPKNLSPCPNLSAMMLCSLAKSFSLALTLAATCLTCGCLASSWLVLIIWEKILSLDKGKRGACQGNTTLQRAARVTSLQSKQLLSLKRANRMSTPNPR